MRTTTKLFQGLLDGVAPLPIVPPPQRSSPSPGLLTFTTKPSCTPLCSLQTPTYLDELPARLETGLSEEQLAAIQAYLQLHEALKREQLRDYSTNDAPYPVLTDVQDDYLQSDQKASLDGLSGPLIDELVLEELEVVGPWYLALKQYLACERVLATGTPYFWPLPFNHHNLGCIKLYFSKARQKNAIGKVLGPSGSTQREIEELTNTTIRIRGQLSERDRAVTGRADRCYTSGDTDFQHIRIENGTVIDKLLAVRLILGILSPSVPHSDLLKATQLAGYAEALGLHAHSLASENEAPWKDSFKIALNTFETQRARTVSADIYCEAIRFRQECLLEAKRQLGLVEPLDSPGLPGSDSSEEVVQAPGA